MTLRIAPASSSSPIPQSAREQRSWKGQVFWLPGLNLLPAPSHHQTTNRAFDSGIREVRPWSQRRDHAGVSPASLHSILLSVRGL